MQPRWFLILRHPIRWACGACFICGTLMYFDAPIKFMGNGNGFCWWHGTLGSRTDVLPTPPPQKGDE